MERKVFGRVAALLIVAAMVAPAASVRAGTLELAPDGDWGQRLTHEEMAELRGGSDAIAVQVVFTAWVSNSGEFNASLDTETDGTLSPTPDFTAHGEARVIASLGNTSLGTGVINVLQVPGDNNSIVSNVYVQIMMISGTEVPNLQTLFSLQ